MPIQIGANGATISGVNYPPYAYIDWLSPAQEALATQGGDAFVVPARDLLSITGNTSAGLPVIPPSEQLAVLTSQHIVNPSTTRQSFLLPSGALWINLRYRLLPGGTATAGQYLKVVANAASDTDAAGRLANGPFLVVGQGEEVAMSASTTDPITRIDIATAQAVGTETTMVSLNAGVRA